MVDLEIAQLRKRQAFWTHDPRCRIPAFEVETFHQAEIRRLIVVLGDLEIDESFPDDELQAWVVHTLMAERREFALCHAGTAHRGRHMRRIKNDLNADGQTSLTRNEKEDRKHPLANG